jgi:energy-coupling factor transport system substrate-specific component
MTTSAAVTPTVRQSWRERSRWRVVDIIVAAVLAVASGVIFWGWDQAWTPLSTPLEAVIPGLSGILGGVWLLAAVLVGLIVRKPGAAVFAEIVAATVEALLPGNHWGAIDLFYGLVQGLGAEIVFAIFLYSSSRVWVAILAGAGAGVGLAVLDLTLYYAGAKGSFDAIYFIASVVSGAIIAGLGSWAIVRALVPTGALRRFAVGRSNRSLV